MLGFNFRKVVTSYNKVLRLVYNMTQGFALCCVATGSAYKIIWTAMQCRNRNFSIFAVKIILYALPVVTQNSANPSSYYKPAFNTGKEFHEFKFLKHVNLWKYMYTPLWKNWPTVRLVTCSRAMCVWSLFEFKIWFVHVCNFSYVQQIMCLVLNFELRIKLSMVRLGWMVHVPTCMYVGGCEV